MRTTGLAILAAACALAVSAPAQATSVPPFKGNDTGGIIAYSLYKEGVDIKALAVSHCAGYGKAVKLTGADAQYGGYISFACVWVHPGHLDRPLRVGY
ncbi:MAG TPA: hypothetical protein VF467_15180 [Afipia sp.]